jgi:hypothetical protein
MIPTNYFQANIIRVGLVVPPATATFPMSLLMIAHPLPQPITAATASSLVVATVLFSAHVACCGASV